MIRNNMRALALVIAIIAGALVLPAQAQYFGQNKVRYKTFNFEVLHTQHFDIYYYKEEADVIPEMGRMAERWYAHYTKLLNWDLSSRQPLIVYADSQDFRSTTVLPGGVGEGTGGVTEALRRRIVMPMAGPLGETSHVLGHELVHAFQYDITTRPGQDIPGAASLPLWFIEGMAEYLSLGPADPQTAMWMRDAVQRNKLPAIKDLDNPEYFPYRWGQALWAYISGKYGEKAIPQMLRVAGSSGRLDAAFQTVLHAKVEDVSNAWHAALKQQYEPVLRQSVPATEESKLLISKKQHGGAYNVSPVLSPDGKQMCFFSSKDLFSIDLYLADANTGEIKRKLTETATNPHIDSLQFINSAGAWSRDGKYFAYPTLSAGRPRLVIYDVNSGDTHEQIDLKQLGEVYNPTWSPDGTQIALSANLGGVTDLFIVDVKTKKIRQLTKDAFADLQPSWSPDGRRIAFVTDQFGTQLQDLSFGRYQIAFIDPQTGDVQPLSTFDSGISTNPQWSSDGNSIFFVSNQDGKPDIYRLYLSDHRIAQVTNLHTGVSGITDLSPAFSVAANSDHLVYTLFSNSDYNLYAINSPQTLAGSPPVTGLDQLSAGILPPRTSATGAVAEALQSPQQGLVSTESFKTTDYHPHLSLDYVSPVSIGVGLSNYGPMVGGGTELYFSDMLGFHNLILSLQSTTLGGTNAGNILNNLGGSATYLNQHSRWTWGLTGGQQPYITGGFGQGLVDIGNGQVGLAQQDITYWEIDRQLAGILAYPFSRAQRIEFQGGYQNIDFAGQSTVQLFDPVTGQFLGSQTQDIPTPDSLNMAVFSSALVYDTSIFGGTSPIKGQSYRFEVGGAAGTLSYGTLLLDYRRYLRLGPITLAGRALHYGRYGGDSEDRRLSDLFIGYSSLVRGYDANSFDASECGPQVQTTGQCPVFDRLLGSRIAVFNAELRLPVLGPLGVIPSRSVPPIELAPFYDTGVAWGRTTTPSFLTSLTTPGATRQPGRDLVSSYGIALRANLFGYAVGEVSLVHPNDRPARNWIWQFSLLPGF